MKIVFKPTIPKNIDAPFVVYQYDAVAENNKYYIDIRGYIRRKTSAWLDVMQNWHAKFSGMFAEKTRWWWTSSMSRMVPKPWGQEKLFKSFFFAVAISEWLEKNPDTRTLYAIGCDPIVAVYLKEFDIDYEISGVETKTFGLKLFLKTFKQIVLAILIMVFNFINIFRYHIFKYEKFTDAKTIILHEYVSGNSISKSAKYYFGNLFESKKINANKKIEYICTSIRNRTMNKLKSGDDNYCFLLDYLNLIDLSFATVKQIHFILLSLFFTLKGFPIILENKKIVLFWNLFVSSEIGKAGVFYNICCYRAFKRFYAVNDVELCIYPYEEKATERAYLFACNEYNVRTIGYAPHPQHQLSLALRQGFKPSPPQPDQFRVCGPAYAQYAIEWCRKKKNIVKIWGSGKTFEKNNVIQKLRRSGLKVLVLLSHPNELNLFYSWLKLENRLTCETQYIIRPYRAASMVDFDRIYQKMSTQFSGISLSHDSLDGDLKKCDISLFCGTSAGLVAINCGYISIYADLNEFFEINPCFNQLEQMFPSTTGKQLAASLDNICSLSAEELNRVHINQQKQSFGVFYPSQDDLIFKDIV